MWVLVMKYPPHKLINMNTREGSTCAGRQCYIIRRASKKKDGTPTKGRERHKLWIEEAKRPELESSRLRERNLKLKLKIQR